MPNAGILKELLDYTGYTTSRLEKEMGYSNGALGKAIKQNGIIKSEKLSKLFEIFPDLNREWIATGKGKIFNETSKKGYIDSNNFVVGDFPEADARPVGAPLERFFGTSGNEFIKLAGGGYMMVTKWIQPKAQMGYMTGWGDDEYMEEQPTFAIFVKEQHKGRYMTFTATGDSMHDGSERSISDGDVITGRLINRSYWRSKFHTTSFKEYIIVHRTDGIVCKEIIEQDLEKGVIKVSSYNPDKEKYPDYFIHLDDVIQIFNVVQVTKPRNS